MTVKELRDNLAQLGPGHDDKEIVVWLPGSRIRLSNKLIMGPQSEGSRWMIEGNVEPGSALEGLL